MVTPIPLHFIAGALPIRGSKPVKAKRDWLPRTHHEHAYSQFVLKTAGKGNEEDRSM
jgi:hypothetical protein